MGADTSIAVAVTDKTTQPLANMRQGFKGLSKDADEARAKLDNFTKMQHSLEHEVDQAAKTMREARKEYAKTNDEVSKTNFEKASQQYDNVRLNLKRVSQSAKEAEKDVLRYSSAQSKADNRAGGMGDVVKKLGAAGATQFLGQAASEVAQTYMTSLLGDAGGTMFGSVLGGAGTGAAIGTAIGGPVGAAVGAVGGAVVGAVQGVTKNAEKKDDSFKSYVSDLYSTVTQNQTDALSNGSTIAGGREQTQMAFAQRFGSDEAATDYLDKVKDMATQTSYTYDEITGYTKKLLNSYDKDSIFGVLMSLSDASAGLDLASSDVDMFISGLSRMKTTGKATMEYLNYFSERGVDVYQALADATGADRSKISDMVTKGKISGDTAAQAILDYINKTFGGLSEKLATTYDAMEDNLQDAKDNIDAAMGEGYNEARKQGIQAESDFLSGESGKGMEEAYKQIGTYKASLENLKEQLNRDAINSVMGGTVADSFKDSKQLGQLQKLIGEYKQAQKDLATAETSGDTGKATEARATMGRALAEAQAMAVNEYNASEGAQLELQSQQELASRIAGDASLQGTYYNAGYTMGQQFSKGLQAAISSTKISAPTTSGGGGSGSTVGQVSGYTSGQLSRGGISARTHAAGLPFVPFDNYPALLHYGERVLTANQARQQDGEGGNVTVSGNSFVIREEADIDKVASALAQKIALAKTLRA